MIERTLKKITLNIHTSRPGFVIGKSGKEITQLESEVKKVTNKEVKINVVEIKKPELSAVLVAENIAQQIANRVSFRRVMKGAITSTMRMGAEGIKGMCGGRLGGAEIARSEQYKAVSYTHLDVYKRQAQELQAGARAGVDLEAADGNLPPQLVPAKVIGQAHDHGFECHAVQGIARLGGLVGRWGGWRGLWGAHGAKHTDRERVQALDVARVVCCRRETHWCRCRAGRARPRFLSTSMGDAKRRKVRVRLCVADGLPAEKARPPSPQRRAPWRSGGGLSLIHI